MSKLNVKGEDDADNDGGKKGQKVVSEKLLFGTHSAFNHTCLRRINMASACGRTCACFLRDMQPPASA